MKVVLLLAADHANIEQQGKLNVLGVFDRLLAQSFPVRHSMHLVVKLRAELGEGEETRTVTISLISEELRETLPRHRQLARTYIDRAIKFIDELIRLQDEAETSNDTDQ